MDRFTEIAVEQKKYRNILKKLKTTERELKVPSDVEQFLKVILSNYDLTDQERDTIDEKVRKNMKGPIKVDATCESEGYNATVKFRYTWNGMEGEVFITLLEVVVEEVAPLVLEMAIVDSVYIAGFGVNQWDYKTCSSNYHHYVRYHVKDRYKGPYNMLPDWNQDKDERMLEAFRNPDVFDLDSIPDPAIPAWLLMCTYDFDGLYNLFAVHY
jgi:hypothetical protein